MAFNSRLREARKNKGLTQKELAEVIGVAKSTVAGYEIGNSEPNAMTIGKIMTALGVDANYLWQDEMAELEKQKDSFTLHEQELIRKYRLIDERGKRNVERILESEYQDYLESGKEKDAQVLA